MRGGGGNSWFCLLLIITTSLYELYTVLSVIISPWFTFISLNIPVFLSIRGGGQAPPPPGKITKFKPIPGQIPEYAQLLSISLNIPVSTFISLNICFYLKISPFHFLKLKSERALKKLICCFFSEARVKVVLKECMCTFKVPKKPNVLNLQFKSPPAAPRGGGREQKKMFALRAYLPP